MLSCNSIHLLNTFCYPFGGYALKPFIFLYSKVFSRKCISITRKSFTNTILSTKLIMCYFCSTSTMSTFRITTKYKYCISIWSNITCIVFTWFFWSNRSYRSLSFLYRFLSTFFLNMIKRRIFFLSSISKYCYCISGS